MLAGEVASWHQRLPARPGKPPSGLVPLSTACCQCSSVSSSSTHAHKLLPCFTQPLGRVPFVFCREGDPLARVTEPLVLIHSGDRDGGASLLATIANIVNIYLGKHGTGADALLLG